MVDITFFTHPSLDWQRRYEALRASFVDRLPDKVVADRFGYTEGYLRLLRHRFRYGKLDFSEPVAEDKSQHRGISSAVRQKIRNWREHSLSAGEIAELLSEAGAELSVRTVERILAEEGFPRLPRRTKLKIGLTVRGAEVPDRSKTVKVEDLDGQRFESSAAGLFLFAPFLAQLDIAGVAKDARLPGTKTIPALCYLLSFLGLKLLGNERYAHVGEHAFDPGLGLFAGLNVVPKCTAMSTYSYSLDSGHLLRLQESFLRKAQAIGLYDGKIINLDFHTVPHYGDESVLERHWAGARGKVMKGALTLFAQDAASKLMLYTSADIHRDEADDQVITFLNFWKKIQRGVATTLVFDSRFTTYSRLSELNSQGVHFITLRRRGGNLVGGVDEIEQWQRIHIPHDKRKYPNPEVHESRVCLREYTGELRQIIVRGNGHEKPTFLLTNDMENPVELVVGNYARRWRVENGIAEAVKFFHLNSLSSPILTKVHFDVATTVIADTLYSMLAKKLRGFEECDASKLHRHFVQGKGTVTVKGGTVEVVYPRRAHNPILRSVDWSKLPCRLPGLGGANLELRFE
jgi:hypothetical protein